MSAVTHPPTARAYELLLLLLADKPNEAELFDSMLDGQNYRDLTRAALALAAVVAESAWGDRAPIRIHRLLINEMGGSA